jgi:DNA-binding Lrp family transcriptional regulator
MGRITINELSSDLKEYLNGLGLTEAQVQELIDKSENEKIGDNTQLNTNSKELVGAINEVFVVASSLNDDEVKRILNEELESIRKELASLKASQEQIIYVLEMKGMSLAVVDGQWYDMLFDKTKMQYTDNIRVVDNNIVVINPINTAEVKYKEVIIGFLASKITYSHELDMQYKEAVAVESNDDVITIKNYTYDFNTSSEEVNYNVE